MHLIGVDLGQRSDPTAIAVVERTEAAGEWDAVRYAYRKRVEYRVRQLERVRLGTPYPEVVARVKEVAEAGELRGQARLVVDATGAGTPVVDLLRRAGLKCLLTPVMITGGEMQRQEQGYYLVPKRDLMAGLVVRLERGELKVAAGLKEGERLMREMRETRVRKRPSGREQFGAWREGEHDDLVLAVALACWGGRLLCPGDWGDLGYVQWR